tara:strand:+ start:1884 stop:2561 length:678 start_codon:yes stop_codon:yes gene_type:complete
MKKTLRETIKSINNMIGRIDHSTIINEQNTGKGDEKYVNAIASRNQNPKGVGTALSTFTFPSEIEDQSDDVKRAWFCMSDRKNRGWNMDDDTYNRFNLLHYAIDGGVGGIGTDENMVWMALAGSVDPAYKGNKNIPKGRIKKDQLKKMLPVISCMKSDKPWEENYMTDNDLDGSNAWGWIMDDFGGVEKCYLQSYVMGNGDRKSCDDKHGYFWWNKASNWLKELF